MFHGDLTIVHADGGENWANYLLSGLKCREPDLKLGTLDLTSLHQQDPKQSSFTQDAHVIVVLITVDFLYFIKEETWLPSFMESNIGASKIFGLYLNVDLDDIGALCDKNNEASNWPMHELMEDGSNIAQLTNQVLEFRESLYIRMQQDIKIVPSAYRAVGELAVIIFPEEVSGEVTLTFSGKEERIPTTAINPYNVMFNSPVLIKDNMYITVLVNGKPTFEIQWQLIDFLSSISCVEFLQQTLGVDSVHELDRMLAEKFKRTLCEDLMTENVLTFEEITNTNTTPTNKTHPTLLHLAAAFDMKELVSVILSSPCASVACATENCSNLLPCDLARQNGHHELSDFMISYMETKEDYYMVMSSPLAEQDIRFDNKQKDKKSYLETQECGNCYMVMSNTQKDKNSISTTTQDNKEFFVSPSLAPPFIPPRHIKDRTLPLTKARREVPILPECKTLKLQTAEFSFMTRSAPSINSDVDHTEDNCHSRCKEFMKRTPPPLPSRGKTPTLAVTQVPSTSNESAAKKPHVPSRR